jgi:NTP pyrophosphatase (non-canonical NTP hydrolase)
MNDAATTVAELRALVRTFVAERRWEPFHTPKNLVMALAVEAAELMEHFQWLDPVESAAVARDPARRDAAAEELADVTCYVLALADSLGIDLVDAVSRKMVKNRAKYPVEQYRGRFGDSDPRPVAD